MAEFSEVCKRAPVKKPGAGMMDCRKALSESWKMEVLLISA